MVKFSVHDDQCVQGRAKKFVNSYGAWMVLRLVKEKSQFVKYVIDSWFVEKNWRCFEGKNFVDQYGSWNGFMIGKLELTIGMISVICNG